MALQEFVISTLAEIPPLVETFAASEGWTVGGTSANPTVKHPTMSGATEFTLRAVQDGTGQSLRDRLLWQGTTQTTYYASTTSPMRGTGTTPTFVAPTKVILISGMTPEPFLAIVIEYGFNLYRHLYLGNMEKLGSYTGGEVISGSQWGAIRSTGDLLWDDIASHQYLFQGYQSLITAANAGGVRVSHIDNPTLWRTFSAATVVNPQLGITFTESGVLGGFRDAINDIYIARGKNSYSGANMLVPVNLYAVRSDNLAPIGRPAGIRLINMQDIEPGALITIGSRNWRCFPAAKKSELTAITRTTNSWPPDETSYYVGYAYLES